MNVQGLIEALKSGLMWICLSALAAIAVGVVGAWLYRSARSVAAWAWRSRSWFEKGVLIGLLSVCILFGGEKMRSGGALGDRALPNVTVEEIAQGWRLVAETNCTADVYAMPEGVSPTFNWHKRGTFGEWARLDLGDFAFPLGTNGGVVTSFSVFNDGRIRPTPRDAAREICAVGVPMLAMQGESRFWVAETARSASGPYRGKVLTWENFFLNADTNAPVNAQIGLFQNGDFTTRSNGVERIYRRVEPFDWDGDGLENTVDPEPLVAGPDAHGTNAEWYNVVCSNVLEAVEGVGSAGTPRPTLSWLDGVNSNAYYFVDVVTERGPVPIYFTGDRDSRLGNPVVVANAFETNRVPLLIGIDYAITSPVPFTVSYPVDYMYPVLETNEPCRASVRWPLEFSVEPDGNGGYYLNVIPYDPGGTFQWGNGGTGGLRSGGIRSGESGSSSCEYSTYGNWLGFMCLGSDCGCHGCSVDGNYIMECSTFNLPTLFCGCSYDDPPEYPPDGPPDEPYSETPSVSIIFSQPALIFEDRYEASPDSWVEKRSTTNVLTVTASGGASGATLILAAQNLGCLRRIGGGPVSLPAELVLGPYMSYKATFRCEGAENGGTPSVGGIILGPDGSDASYAQTSVVRVDIQPQKEAPTNQCLRRHKFGIGEVVFVYQYPTSPLITVSATDAKIGSASLHRIEWGVSNVEHELSFSLNEVEYFPLVTVKKPTAIEGYDAQAETYGLPTNSAGGLKLVQRYRVLPLDVSFEWLKVEEVPCYDEIPPTGYFMYTPTNIVYRSHTKTAGAGKWWPVEVGNYYGQSDDVRDAAGIKGELPRITPEYNFTTNTAYGWMDGSLVWKVPFGWKHVDAPARDEAVGTFADETRQVFTITEAGDFSVQKLQHTAMRQTNCVVTVDGHVDDGILDN